MLKLLSAVLLINLSSLYGFDTNIDLDWYRNCYKEIVVHQNVSGKYSDFEEFFLIQNVSTAISDSKVAIRFYFQGRADFSVALLPNNEHPSNSDEIFRTRKICFCNINIKIIYILFSDIVWT